MRATSASLVSRLTSPCCQNGTSASSSLDRVIRTVPASCASCARCTIFCRMATWLSSVTTGWIALHLRMMTHLRIAAARRTMIVYGLATADEEGFSI